MPARVMPVGLSKSRTLKGLPCHKLLWWMAHEPAAAELEIDPQRRAVLDMPPIRTTRSPCSFSCHVEDAGGHVTHQAWLAEGPEDPRPALAERLVAACEGARTIVAYNAPFERRCIAQLGETVPSLAGRLGSSAERLVDLLPIVRNHVYHPDFGGSFSLKRVLPALVPEARYDELAIPGGQTASLELARLLLRGDTIAPTERDAVRRALLEYCHLDTRGLVELLARLRLLALTCPPRIRRLPGS